MFDQLTLKTCTEALANNEWLRLDVEPRVGEEQAMLFYVANRDFLTISYSSLIIWPPNSDFSLDFEIDEVAPATWLQTFGASWFFPCHAKILHAEHGEVASISGIMTFENWTSLDEHDDLAESPEGENPLLVAIASSIGFESDRDNAALANAARLVLQLEPDDSLKLQQFLNEHPKEF